MTLVKSSKFPRNTFIPLDATDIEILIPERRLLDKHTVTLARAFLNRLCGTLALMNGPHQRMTLSWPSGSWHSTHGPRITNWGPNQDRPAPWPLYLSILLSAYITSLYPCLDVRPFDSELVSGVSNLQRRNTLLHRQRASWSVCLGYVTGIRGKKGSMGKQRLAGEFGKKKRSITGNVY